MVRLCFLIRQLNQGGAQRQLLDLARGLDKSRFVVFVLTFYDGGIYWEEAQAIENLTVVSLNKRGRWDTVCFFLNLCRKLYRLKPDILCSYLGTSNILSALVGRFLPGARVVWSIRSSDMDLTRYDSLTRLLFRTERRLSRLADLIIFNSAPGYQHHVDMGFKGKTMVVIQNGIDTERYFVDRDLKHQTRADLGLESTHKVVGFVGRLDPMKDPHTFFRAASILVRGSDDFRFLFVGDGPESCKVELHSLARELGIHHHVLWGGVRSDMTAVYSCLDLLASSSVSEGFPNVIGEAMACGVPCVVTDVGESARIVGESGLVVPPRNPAALADGIKSMFGKSAFREGRLQQDCRSRIVDHFSLARLVRSSTESFGKLL